jgi:hypothetical protein
MVLVGRVWSKPDSIQIRSHGGPLLDAFVTPIIALGSGEDGTPRIAEGIKRNNVRVMDSRHCEVVVRRGREETVIGKGLTAGSSPPYQ